MITFSGKCRGGCVITFSGQCRGGCVIIPSDHDKNLLSPAHSHSSQLIQMLGRLRDYILWPVSGRLREYSLTSVGEVA